MASLSEDTQSSDSDSSIEEGEVQDDDSLLDSSQDDHNPEVIKYKAAIRKLSPSLRCTCCGDVYSDPAILPRCKHKMNRDCILLNIRHGNVLTCPMCKRRNYVNNIDDLQTDYDMAIKIPPKPASWIARINRQRNQQYNNNHCVNEQEDLAHDDDDEKVPNKKERSRQKRNSQHKHSSRKRSFSASSSSSSSNTSSSEDSSGSDESEDKHLLPHSFKGMKNSPAPWPYPIPGNDGYLNVPTQIPPPHFHFQQSNGWPPVQPPIRLDHFDPMEHIQLPQPHLLSTTPQPSTLLLHPCSSFLPPPTPSTHPLGMPLPPHFPPPPPRPPVNLPLQNKAAHFLSTPNSDDYPFISLSSTKSCEPVSLPSPESLFNALNTSSKPSSAVSSKDDDRKKETNNIKTISDSSICMESPFPDPVTEMAFQSWFKNIPTEFSDSLSEAQLRSLFHEYYRHQTGGNSHNSSHVDSWRSFIMNYCSKQTSDEATCPVQTSQEKTFKGNGYRENGDSVDPEPKRPRISHSTVSSEVSTHALKSKTNDSASSSLSASSFNNLGSSLDDSHSLCVANLPDFVKAKDVYELVSAHGEVLWIRVVCVTAADVPVYMALVTMASDKCVDRTVAALNGSCVFGKDHVLMVAKTLGESSQCQI